MPFRIAALRTRKALRRASLILAASLAATVIPGLPARAADSPGQAFTQKLEGTDVSFKMLPIPAGTFNMGSPDNEAGHKADEAPQHQVKVDAFYMEEHPVTWAEYNLFLNNYSRLSSKPPVQIPQDKMADAVTFPTPMYDVEAGPALQRMGGRTGNFPAVIMSQFAARQYTKWLSKKTGRFYRLPCEAEYEYAVRAGTTTAYFFGNDPKQLGDYAWYHDNSTESDGDTGYHEVMKKKPNPWGLYDITGNVAEWCVDVYDKSWYSRFAGKTTDWADTVNWANMPVTQYPRVLRGGGYDADAVDLRSAARLGSSRLMNNTDPQIPKSPHWMSDGFFIGFRVVSPVKTPSPAEQLRWWNADDQTTERTIERDRERRELVPVGAVEK